MSNPEEKTPMTIRTGMGPVTDRFINEFINGLDMADYKDRINDKIFDPVFDSINNRIRPYFYTGVLLYVINLILLIVIIYILLRKKS